LKNKSYKFVEGYKRSLTISIVALVVILAATLIMGVNLDIQFSGGAIITYSYDGEIDVAEFAGVAQDVTGSAVAVQQTTHLGADINMETMIVSLPGSLLTEQINELTEGLQAAFPDSNIHAEQINNVSASMGREFLLKCLTAILFAFLVMIVFIAIRFKRIGGLSAGVMSVIGLIHDVAIVFGVHVLFRIPLSGNFIAVVLTILGYSINDTIVVYDRIRENTRLYGKKLGLAELVDLSINQSLRRTINTTISTVAAMTVVAVVAYIFNIGTIVTFAFPMVLGLLTGVYSTIFIAGPLWVRWRERTRVVAGN